MKGLRETLNWSRLARFSGSAHRGVSAQILAGHQQISRGGTRRSLSIETSRENPFVAYLMISDNSVKYFTFNKIGPWTPRLQAGPDSKPNIVSNTAYKKVTVKHDCARQETVQWWTWCSIYDKC